MSEEEKPNWLQKRSRRMARRAGMLGVLVLVIAWILSQFMGHGAGSGGGATSSSSSTTPSSSGTSLVIAEPVEVVVHEDHYLVDAKELTLPQIIAAAAGHAAPAVKIVSGADSRLGAQRDLESGLDAAHVSWSIESEPVSAP